MLLLGIDTSTRRVGVVLADEAGMLGRVELGSTTASAPPRHAETLAPAEVLPMYLRRSDAELAWDRKET